MLRTVQLYESEHSHNWLSTSHIGRGSTKIPPKANTNNNKKKQKKACRLLKRKTSLYYAHQQN